jgi:hypothetical protein
MFSARFLQIAGLRPLLLAALFAVITGSASADDAKNDGGWIQLFDGKDLTGWKMVNPPSGQFSGVTAKKNADGKVVAYVGTLKDGKKETLWHVENGLLIGSGHSTHLFSDGVYDNFRYRVTAKINDHGNSGQYFRAKLAPGFPPGYEAQINATHGDPIRTGSLYPAGGLGKYRKQITVMNKAPNKPNEFFTQEVIADGNHIVIKVNGKTTVDWTDPNKTFMKGHFALQGHDPGTVVTFKKIEYQPLKK